jgi:hypothetical protein
VEIGGSDEHDAVDHQRSALKRGLPFLAVTTCMVDPGHPKIVNIMFIDLLERREMAASRIAAIVPPIAPWNAC